MLIGQEIPGGLAAMPPGSDLARTLADLDLARVPNDDILDVLAAHSRQLSHAQARMFTALSEVVCRLPFAGPGEVLRADVPEPYGADEVRAALSWTRRAADAETDLAYALVHDLPLVHAALQHGHIDRPKAAVFVRHLADLSPAQIAAVCVAVLPRAPRLTTGQIAERLKRLVLELDPAHYERRYRKAVRDRKVVAYLDHDGTAVISAQGLPADEAAAAWERVDVLARTARRDGHPATLDQIRADIVLGLLDGTLHNLDRDQILQALLERFAGHADTDTDNATASGAQHGDGDGNGTRDNRVLSGRAVAAREDNDCSGSGDRCVAPGGEGGGDGGGSTAGPEHVQVGTEIRVPLSTLLGLDNRAGELPGWGPVPADTARRTVARQRRAQWRWVVVDDEGHLIAEGITRHRPTTVPRGGPRGGVVEIQVPASLLAVLAAAPGDHGPWAGVITDIADQYTQHTAQDSPTADLDAHPRDRFPRAGLRRHTQVRDRTCVHPGCRAPAQHADQDHTLDHVRGGTTTQDDLAPLCRHDHVLKTDGGWRLRQPEPGRFVWRSPLGGIYSLDPEPILPPPPTPVPREPEARFDDPAPETDHRPELTPHDRAPPTSAPGPDPTYTSVDDDPPPF